MLRLLEEEEKSVGDVVVSSIGTMIFSKVIKFLRYLMVFAMAYKYYMVLFIFLFKITIGLTNYFYIY